MTAPVLPLPPERRRRADAKLTDPQVRVLHRLHVERGESIRELGRAVWKQAGFASPGAAGRAIARAFDRMHLPARPYVESRELTRQKGYRRCAETNAAGEQCESFAMGGADLCWPHRFPEQAREQALASSPWVEAAA